jgi:uncharacterized membrane protein
MNVNEPHPAVGFSGVLRAIGVLAVLILALVASLVVLDFIPREALQEWLTKFGLIALIVVAAAVALMMLMKKS